MTNKDDLSGNDSSNNEDDLSNNDLSNNDLSNNDLSNNDLSNNNLFSELVDLYKPLHNPVNISIELKEKQESNSDSSDNENEKLDDELYYNYLYDDKIDHNKDISLNEFKDSLDKIDDLLKIIDEMYVLDKNIKYLDEQIKNNYSLNDDNNKNENDNKKTKKNLNKKLNIKDNNKHKSMYKNKLVDDIIKEMDNNYGNSNKPYYNVNDLLFLNNNNLYKNYGANTNLNIRNPSLPLSPLIHNNNLNNNLTNSKEQEKLEEQEPEEEIEIEEVNVEASIENIEDLIKMIDKYPLDKHIKYNINMKAMHDIKPDLIELNKMIGMHNLKMNIVDQILYFVQDLHINESKKKEKQLKEKELKEKELKEKELKEKQEPRKKPPTISFRGGAGGFFSGIDLSSAFGGSAIKEPICTDNDNNDYLHTVIYGPPGTGKTEVAKIMGKIYSKLGILKKGLFKKATRSDFVAGYLGQTAMKTKELIEECLGGVLFIDEAYALGNNEGRDSFAKEAIDTLCEGLSNHKNDIMVIIAGYEKELNDCFFSFNQGLESRFPWRFKTEDYKPEELKLIFKKQVLDSEWKIDDEDLKDEWFNSKMNYFKHYGRDMETLFSKVKIAHGRRIFCNLDCEKKKLTIQDLDKGFKSYLENENKQNIEQERIVKQIRDTLYV